MPLSKYCKIYPYNEPPDSAILFSTSHSSTIIVPRSMLKDIEHGDISEEEGKALGELGFFVDPAKESAAILGFLDDLNEMDNIFHVKIVMNLDCNLACKYCFEGGRKGKFYMAKETADRIVDFVAAAMGSNKEELHVTFYGGEPLLSLRLIEYMTERLKLAAQEGGVEYKAFMITNGTLLTAGIAGKLKSLGLKEVAVTVDGPKNVHDSFRPFQGGKGSFNPIMRNVRDICEIITVQLGGNYSKNNYREMPELLDYLKREGLTTDMLSLVRFDPVFSERADVGPPEYRDGCSCLNEPWFYDASLFLREELLKRGYNVSRMMPSMCMMEIKDRLVINYDGTIYKCPGLIGRKEFCVGDILSGINDYRNSHNLDNWKNEECLNCAYLPLCFGGCRYMKYIRDGHMKGVDCRKPYFDATLEALVKQDIKYGLTPKG